MLAFVTEGLIAYAKLKKSWGRLTPDEQTYVTANPTHSYYIKRNSDTALAEAQKRFTTGLLNGPGDAFRHCFWSSMLARDLGFQNALQFTTAHESSAGNPADQREMDLWNNAIGLGIGQRLATADDATLAVACIDALTSRTLKVITP